MRKTVQANKSEQDLVQNFYTHRGAAVWRSTSDQNIVGFSPALPPHVSKCPCQDTEPHLAHHTSV